VSANYTRRYTILGALFGLSFPIFASVISIISQNLTVNLQTLFRIQAGNPLLWVIDTAPLFLGLFAAIAGRRQDQIVKINEELEDKFVERQHMVAKLVALQNNLERQVEVRTAELELRKSQFEAVAEVARTTAGIRDLDDLLDQSTALITQTMGFYHTGIFLLDEDREFAVLKAASSPGGKRMLVRRYKLALGHKSLVGVVANNGEPSIAVEAGVDAAYFNNPELPETRSTLAIPLIIRGAVIGVLNVQSKEANAFSDEDLHALQILSDQLSMAIETTRLIQEKQEALDVMNRTYQEFTQQSWFNTFRTQSDIAFRCDSHGRILPLQDAEGSILETDGKGDRQEDQSLSIPLKIRDQTVGEVRFKKSMDAAGWTEDEVSLLETLTDQVSVAMDSARLYMDSQRRAEREKLVADITTKIRETNDPKQILQTAVRELQSALRAQKAQIKFQSFNPSDIGPPGSDEAGKNGDTAEGAA
jgi:GAF domain-containing protein